MKMVTFHYIDGTKERMTEEAAQEIANKMETAKKYLMSKGISKEEVEKNYWYQIIKTI